MFETFHFKINLFDVSVIKFLLIQNDTFSLLINSIIIINFKSRFFSSNVICLFMKMKSHHTIFFKKNQDLKTFETCQFDSLNENRCIDKMKL